MKRIGPVELPNRGWRDWIATVFLLLTCSAIAAEGDAKSSSTGADVKTPGAAHSGTQGSAPGFTITPLPVWVVPARAPADASAPGAPMHYEILDEQVRLSEGGVSHFTRVVRVVDGPSGLTAASDIKIEYDPSYQRLALHRLRILRGQRTIDALDRKRVRLLQRETQLERQIYDGRVTAAIMLEDIRPGDRIEYAYTVSGSNPVFEGRYVDTIYAASFRAPAALFQLRLLSPEARTIHARTPDGVESSSRVQSGVRETIFRRPSVPQLQFDPSAPGDQWIGDVIQLSEFNSWEEVGRWAYGLFAEARLASAVVHQQAESIRNATTDPAEQLRNALDFVQTQIRYFGTEMGVNSHRPAAPDKVLAQRFGDCKDKVGLLIAIATDLGFDAEPVLVPTQLRDAVSDMLPSPLDFDHVIARVSAGGKVFLLDPTRSHQTGPIDGRQVSGLGKGLVAAAQATPLVDLPRASSELRMEVKDLFRAKPISGDTVLESRVTYFGELAETLREAMSNRPVDEVERQLDAEYLRLFPKAKPDGSMQFQDATDRNAIEVTRRYVVPAYWRFPERKTLAGDFALWSLIQALQRPDDASRSKPFRFPYAGIFRHSTAFEFSEDIASRKSSKRTDESDVFFDYHALEETEPRRYRLDGELHIARETVGVQDWQAFREKSGALRTRLVGALSIGSIAPDRVESLKAAIQGLDEDVRNGKIKVATVQEAEDRVRALTLDFEIDGGRLNDEARAEALVERGDMRRRTGRAAEATSDFDEALRLMPDSAEAYAAAAVNSLWQRKDSVATWQANKAIELAPSSNSARFTRAYAEFYQRSYEAARQDFAEILKTGSDVERTYAAIWEYLTDRRNGITGTDAAKDLAPGDPGSGWPYTLLQAVQEVITPSAAANATKSGERGDPGKLCELYFYMGVDKLAIGNRPSATEFFKKSLETGAIGRNEYAFARRELDLLDGISAPHELASSGSAILRNYVEVVRPKPDYASVFFSRGNGDQAKGDYDSAIRDYDEAIRQKPDFAEAFNNRGTVYKAKGDRDHAIRDYGEAIRLKPNYFEAFYNRGIVYQAKGDFDSAVRDYNEAIRIKPDYASAFLNRGILFQANRDNDHAIRDYNEAIRLQPDHASAFIGRGNAYQAKGDYDGAIRDFDEAIRLKPDYASVFMSRGNAYQAKGDHDHAIRDYGEAIRLKPDFAEALNNRGNEYRANGDNDHAIRDYDEAVRLKPNNAEPFNNRGIVYQAKGDYSRAIRDYDEAIRLKPDYASAFYNRGMVYQANGDHDHAIRDYNEAIRLKPDYASAFVSRGNTYKANGDNEHAFQDYDEAIRLKPDYASAFIGRGNVYQAKGDYDSAIRDYDEAIRLTPSYAEEFNNRGLAYWGKRDYDSAIRDCNEAIRLKPDYASAFITCGNSYKAKGDFDNAIRDYSEAIRLKPDYASAFISRGVAYRAKGDYDSAIRDYGEAIRLTPDYAPAYLYRGYTYFAKGDYDGAIRDYNEAIRLKPDYAEAFNNRGVAYVNKRDYDNAIRDCNEAIRLKPNYAPAFMTRGNAYKANGDHDHAIRDLDEAIRLWSDNPHAFNNRGNAYQAKGDYDSAIRDYDEAIRLKPDFANAFNNRCWTRAIANRALEAALFDCNESLRLKPDTPVTLDSRGFVELRMGHYDEAIADFDKSLSGEPKSADSLYARGLAKRMRNDVAGSDADIAAAKAIEANVAERYAGYGVSP